MTICTRPVTKEYEEGWDEIFKEKPSCQCEPQPEEYVCPSCGLKTRRKK